MEFIRTEQHVRRVLARVSSVDPAKLDAKHQVLQAERVQRLRTELRGMINIRELM